MWLVSDQSIKWVTTVFEVCALVLLIIAAVNQADLYTYTYGYESVNFNSKKVYQDEIFGR